MKDNLAVQLYTLRDHLHTAADFKSSIERIAQIGYGAVQLSAVGAMNGDNPALDVTTAKQILDSNGVKCIATHRSWDQLSQETGAEIEFHRALDCDFTAIGGIPAPYKEAGADGYRRWCDEAAPVIAKLKAGGMRFGYHNHAFELERVDYQNGGPRTLLDLIIDCGNPDMLLELDLYWLGHGGANPQRVVERCAGRMPVIHIKDKEMIGQEPRMAPIGEGNMDWANLIPACLESGVEWIAIEQDNCYRDGFDCLKSSYDYLTNLEVAN